MLECQQDLKSICACTHASAPLCVKVRVSVLEGEGVHKDACAQGVHAGVHLECVTLTD